MAWDGEDTNQWKNENKKRKLMIPMVAMIQTIGLVLVDLIPVFRETGNNMVVGLQYLLKNSCFDTV